VYCNYADIAKGIILQIHRPFLRGASFTGALCFVFGTTVVFRGPGMVKDSETWPEHTQQPMVSALPQRRVQTGQGAKVTVVSTVQRRLQAVPVVH
jgi:hypothetical protein